MDNYADPRPTAVAAESTSGIVSSTHNVMSEIEGWITSLESKLQGQSPSTGGKEQGVSLTGIIHTDLLMLRSRLSLVVNKLASLNDRT